MKFLVTLLIALVTFATADAAKVDIYKAALQNKTFTLKYKVNEFPVRSIRKNVTFKFDFLGNAEVSKRQSEIKAVDTGGIIVFNKDDSYFENFHDSFTQSILGDEITFKAGGGATLFKNGETFQFYLRLNDDGTKDYFNENMWGIKSSKVKAQSENDAEKIEKYMSPYVKLFQDYNFGNPDLYQALQPILPPEQIIATPNTPTYKFVSAGNLDDGLSYEDFYGEKNNAHYAIRYYFSGDKMTKIATFTYIKNSGDVQFYEKHVIDIEEFLTTADENYLQLPANLQDTTKRDKDGGKQ